MSTRGHAAVLFTAVCLLVSTLAHARPVEPAKTPAPAKTVVPAKAAEPAKPAHAPKPKVAIEVILPVKARPDEIEWRRVTGAKRARERLKILGVRPYEVVPQGEADLRILAPDVPGVEEALARRGQVRFYLVDDSPESYTALGSLPAGVTLKTWKGPKFEHRQLVSRDRHAIERAVADRIPAGIKLGILTEYVEERAAFEYAGMFVQRTQFVPIGMPKSVELEVGPDGEQRVLYAVQDREARVFELKTTEHVGHRLAIMVDGEIEHAPKIREPIKGGRFQITRCAWRGRPDAPELARGFAAALAAPYPLAISIVGSGRVSLPD